MTETAANVIAAPIRILIGSRDPAAQALIADVLRRHPHPVVLTTAVSSRGLVAAIESGRPDLVFLDVQRGKPDAFDVIAAVGSARMPPVVLMAATREFAARAFEVKALDYLVRPLSRQRVIEAVGRARDHVVRERAFAARRPREQVRPQQQGEAPGARIMVRDGKRRLFIDPAEIEWIEGGHNYVRLHVASKSYRVRRTLAELEASLGVHQFARIHRGILVRLGRIRELRLKPGGGWEAVLKNRVALPVSRTYRTSLLAQLGGV